MDTMRDYDRFTKLVARLCDTLRGPNTPLCSDELVESWWKALRHLPFEAIERKVDEYLAKADETTRFPRPAQMREKDQAPQAQGERNWMRDYWRTTVVKHVAGDLGLTLETLEPVIIGNRETLGADMLALLDRCCTEELQHGRTFTLEQFCRNRAGMVATRYSDLGTEHCVARRMPRSELV